jgi:hypothetical protein
MLFLAITGALFAALMIGVGTGVTQQRYSDSVRSYKALLQNQYTAVLNTENSADSSKFQCQNATNGVTDTVTTQLTKGTSDCVILGRVVRVTNDGQTVETASVTGYEPTSASDQAKLATADDLQALELYHPIASTAPFDLQRTDLDWQSSLDTFTPDSSGKNTVSTKSTTEILILRSPSSGTIKVFVSPSAITGSIADFLKNFAATPNSATKITDCIDGDSGLLPKQLVTVDATIASTDGVSTSDVPYGKECH